MAAGPLSDADVFGSAPGAPPPAAAQVSGDGVSVSPVQPGDAVPPPPAGAPPGDYGQPVMIDIRKGVAPNVGQVQADVGAADQADAQGASSANPAPMSDADVFGNASSAAAATTSGKPDFGFGFEVGAMKPLDNLLGGVRWAENKLGIPTDGGALSHLLGVPTYDQFMARQQQHLTDEAKQGIAPGKGGELLGNIVGTLPTLAIPGGELSAPLLQGAASAALTSNAKDPLGLLGDTGIGVVGGVVGNAAMKGLASAVAPVVEPAVRALLNAGVKLTPGQILGGTAHRLEDAATSIPILGDAIKTAQLRGVKSLDTAAINRSIAPIGATLPPNAQYGRAALDFAHGALSDAYDDATAKMAPVQNDTSLQQVISDILARHGPILADGGQQLQNIIDSRLNGRFGPNGYMSGVDFKDVDSQIGQQAANFGSATDGNQRNLGSALGEVQDELRAAAQRSDPAGAQRLNDINSGYANLVRVEKAGGGVGAKGGVFSGPQLQAAVRAGDSSARKSAFARGNAPMQDLSDAAAKVLPSTVPDSGTALRYLLSELPILAGVGAESHVLPLGAIGTGLIGGGMLGSAYTKLGQAAVTKLLTARPPGAEGLAQLLNRIRPLAAPAAAASTASLPKPWVSPATP